MSNYPAAASKYLITRAISNIFVEQVLKYFLSSQSHLAWPRQASFCTSPSPAPSPQVCHHHWKLFSSVDLEHIYCPGYNIENILYFVSCKICNVLSFLFSLLSPNVSQLFYFFY